MSGPLPKCSASGCHLWVWNKAPQHIERGMVILDGPSAPQSDKCWYHGHGQTPPPEAR